MYSRSVSRRRGSALIIVLAFVVLTAIVMLSYLASTQSSLKKSSSSAAMVETDLLAEAATGAILDDIRQEMIAGADSFPQTNQPMTATNTWSMVPGRVLSSGVGATDTNFANLVKQSLRTAPFYPGNNPSAAYSAKGSLAGATGRSRASAVNSSQNSLNGRMISPDRWNKPMLLSGAGFTTTNQLPDWILISRSGPVTNGVSLGNYTNKATSNTQYVIGRYAYNIYDIGGLLDINIAGYNSADASAAKHAEKKGSIAWADLSALPGVLDQTALIKEWRNRLSTDNGDTYQNMIKSWGQPRGFSEPFQTNGKVENRFFSRQDLLKYQQTYGATAIATNALPYFTTFSADIDRPSFAPFYDAGLARNRPFVQQAAGMSGGNDARGEESSINPNFLTTFDTSGSEIKPRVKRRFPLDRLKFLVPYPAEDNKDDIWNYFGLVWSGPDYGWIYTDIPGTTVASTRIKRLSEIQNREPNFIELLKAAIGVGSLGGQFENNNPQEPTTSPRILGGPMASTDYQIMKIAASIIDQYDTDSYPTRLFFGTDGSVPREFYGIEDLPYLYVIRNMVYRKGLVAEDDLTVPVPTEGAPGTWDGRLLPYRCVMMMQPTLWNPHAANTDSPPTEAPTAFRVCADSNGGTVSVVTAGSWWRDKWAEWAGDPEGVDQPSITSKQDYDASWGNDYPSKNAEDLSAAVPVIFNPASNFLSFNTQLTGPASFREPYTLTSRDYPVGSGAVGYVEETVLPNEEPNEMSGGVTTPRLQTIGFRVGILWGGPAMVYDTTNDVYNFLLQNKLINSDGINFELKFLAPNGTYYTYDRMDAFAMTRNPGWHDDVRRPTNINRGLPLVRYGLRVDPRTQRYGFRDSNLYCPKTFRAEGPTNASNLYRIWLQGMTAWPTHPTGLAGTRYGKAGNAMSSGHKNTTWTISSPDSTYMYWCLIGVNGPASAIRYLDPDGIRRNGMAADFAETTAGLPFVTNNTASRPIILNRPFRSVAELGNVCRDQPWKQLDFWTPQSADAALLDVFCINEPLAGSDDDMPVTAGNVNLNTRQAPVLQAMLQGVAKSDGVKLTAAQAKSIATALVNWTTNSATDKGPLRNRSELVGRLTGGTTYAGFSGELGNLLGGTEGKIQSQRQSVMRALADSGTTRTWTFLIDLVVQEGRYPTADLAKFSVEGEQRYWIQVAIDRFTGETVAKFIEAVNE